MNQRRTILVVDRDDGLRGLLCHILESAGYRVEETSTASDVIEKGNSVDMILLDLKLENPEGKEALEELRKRKVWTPVVILTDAELEAELEEQLRRLKIVVLLKKCQDFAKLRVDVLTATKDKLRTRQAMGALRETNAMLDECMKTAGTSAVHRAV